MKTLAEENRFKQSQIECFINARHFSEHICEPLETEDFGLQAKSETSPIKWHLAHTSWFFETFILSEYAPQYEVFDQSFHELFNSYYNSVGQPFKRANRGLISRPTVAKILQYRKYINKKMVELLENSAIDSSQSISRLLQIGIQHEKQHQELMLADLKYNFYQNPQLPIYSGNSLGLFEENELKWNRLKAGIYIQGNNSKEFCFDNEQPSHQVYLHECEISSRLVTNGEYLKFCEDDAYRDPLLWLSDGWTWLQKNKITNPYYWMLINNQWHEYTLHGLRLLDLNAPVCHVNFYEADAYARWAGCRLPTEFEWEQHALQSIEELEIEKQAGFHPQHDPNSPSDLFHQVWQWTSSDYAPYPGYRPAKGAIGEYNGKFMCNQKVLRGGSCFSPDKHIRLSYRNFFYPSDFWQMSGIRLAR